MIDPIISTIPALSDNFIHVIHDSCSAIAIDPAVPEPVSEFLNQNGLQLTHIIITHHHHDHTGGCTSLKEQTGCVIVGPDDPRLPFIDETDCASLGTACDMIATPGHTSSHVCYHFPGPGALFSGDTLFLGGCGRLFEGSANQMWSSLLKLRRLPPETMVFPGHDYTMDNLDFCESVLPGNERIKNRISKIRGEGPPTHAPLSEELETNVFLMCDDPAFPGTTGLQGYPADLFAQLRERKDRW